MYGIIQRMEDVNKTIARNLKLLRESFGESQTAFAKRVGVQQRTYNRMEQAEHYQHLESVQTIAEKCDLQTWQLLVPGFNPTNPPMLKQLSVAEQSFYDRINKLLDDAKQ